MALYTLSDTHLSLSCDKPMDIFGSRWKNHTEKLKILWNSTVSEEDTVVIGGDISWGLTMEEALPDLLFIDSLKGNKILLRGNHDFWWTTISKISRAFEENGIGSITLLQNNAIKLGNLVICGSRGWYNDPQNATAVTNCDHKKIVARECQRLRLSLTEADRLGGEKIVFMHFPPVFADYVCRELINVLHESGIKRVYYGHIHGSYNIPPSSVFEGIEFTIVSADYLDFRPLRIE